MATVSLTVTPVNDAPVAVADSYSTAEDTALTVAACLAVLGNDTDVDGDPLTAIQVSGPAHGTLTLNADGSFVYTPAADYNGRGQLHLQGERRHGGLERGDGDAHGDAGERRAGGGGTTATARRRTRR